MRWVQTALPESLATSDITNPRSPAVLAGDWQLALSALGGNPPPTEFSPIAKLLADACRAAGREDYARRLASPG